jgi:hypothetical protein
VSLAEGLGLFLCYGFGDIAAFCKFLLVGSAPWFAIGCITGM